MEARTKLEEARRQLAAMERRNAEPEAASEDVIDANLCTTELAYEDYLASVNRHAKEDRDHENALYVVCPKCYRKQPRGRETCELCGTTSERWELAATDPPNLERCRYIAASTVYTAEELNRYIASTSVDLPFVKHCARMLELRRLPRVKSFWERAGFDIEGHTLSA